MPSEQLKMFCDIPVCACFPVKHVHCVLLIVPFSYLSLWIIISVWYKVHSVTCQTLVSLECVLHFFFCYPPLTTNILWDTPALWACVLSFSVAPWWWCGGSGPNGSSESLHLTFISSRLSAREKIVLSLQNWQFFLKPIMGTDPLKCESIPHRSSLVFDYILFLFFWAQLVQHVTHTHTHTHKSLWSRQPA